MAFPALPPPARRRLGRRSFQHLGIMLIELCRVLEQPPDRVLEGVVVEGLDHLRQVMTNHGRALAVTAHLGNWELLTLAHRLTGFSLAIVVRPVDAPVLDALMRRLRGAAGAEIIAKRNAVRTILGALRRGRLVGLLLDQNASRREGVFVPFFGRLASTSRSVATLALRTGVPVVPLFIRRERPGRHRIIVGPPILPSDRNATEQAVVEVTMRCTQAIEQAIREAPEQWLWMHDRWRTRPVVVREPS